MPNYLLPCTCGKKTAVSTAQAGDTVHCACGAALQVPTMRALGKLESADAVKGDASRRPRTWEDRHRAAFLLVLASLACLGVAGYLWVTIPPSVAGMYRVDEKAIAESFDKAAPVETLEFYQEMLKGLGPAAVDHTAKSRQMMSWGIGIAVALAAAALAVAMLVVLRQSGRRS